MHYLLKLSAIGIISMACWTCSLAAQGMVNVRIMAANLNGNTQSYQPFALRILQGLQPDVVCIQEFNYGGNAASDFRSMLDLSLGTNFIYYREPFNGSGDIPNGIITHYPILAAGSWADAVQSQPNRGFAWAQIQVPGTNLLYVVSVHLLTSSAANRGAEAANLQALIQANFPSNAWVVVAGDFNTDTRTESPTMTIFDSYLSDNPIPDDGQGNSDTSENRDHPHDYVLPSFSFTNLETASVLPSHSFPNGLVFDSTVYTPLSDVSPVQYGDSTNAQHMAVIKDFLIPVVTVTNPPATNAPVITVPPASQIVSPGSNASFTVTASGAAPLAYQWSFNTVPLSGATNSVYILTPVQFANAGSYFVVVTNAIGSVTSSPALLVVSNFPPVIQSGPQSQTLSAGATASFYVTAGGTAPLGCQWWLGNAPIAGAAGTSYSLPNVQTNSAGNYFVVVTNVSGSVTSAVAVLTVLSTNPVVLAQWNFNSVTPDNSTTTGSTAPSIGTGTASLLSGNTASFATGDQTLDPAGTTDNSGWNTTSYPTQATGNKTRGVQFAVSTAGKQNIAASWSSQSSNTGSKYGRLQYTTNGTDYVDFPAAFTNGTTFTPKTNSLAALAGVNNNPNFAIRLVSEFESTALGTANNNYVATGPTSSYAPTGTMRYDLVTIYGTSIITNPPALAPNLGTITAAAGLIQFTVSGTAGSSYIVQTTTNLADGVWIPVVTNAAPYTFVDTNLTGTPLKCYRAVTAP
jgi:endonuclease/exonuclease/phosphatase family metal-dependent hydrolase